METTDTFAIITKNEPPGDSPVNSLPLYYTRLLGGSSKQGSRTS